MWFDGGVRTTAAAPEHRTRSDAGEFMLAYLVAAAVAVPWIGWRLRNLGVPIDFAVYRTGGLHVLHGVDLFVRQSSNLRVAGFGQSYVLGSTFSYPPFAALTFVPLSVLPPWVGAIVWELGALAALVVLVGISFQQMLDASRHRWHIWGAVSAVAALTTPVTDTLFFGQINLFLVLLIVLDCTKSTRWQGIGTGLAAAIKLTPLPFIAFFLITRQWRAAIRAGSVFMVATGLAWVVLPSASWGYWTNPSASLRRVGGIPTFTNQSLHGMFEVLGLPMWGLAIAVIGVTAAGMVAARRRYEGGDILGAACCVGLVTLLISPVSWVHHGVWIVPIAGILVAGGRDALRTSAVAVPVVFFVLRLPLLGSVLLAHGGPSPLAKLLEVSDVLAYLALLVVLAVGVNDSNRTPILSNRF